MSDLLLGAIIAGPIALGILAWITPTWSLKRAIVIASALLTAAAGVWFCAQGSRVCTVHLPYAAQILEILLVLAVIVLGIAVRSWLVFLLGIFQALVATAEFLWTGAAGHGEGSAAFVVDPLSMVMVLIITLVGSCIVVYAVGYMHRHGEHAPSTAASMGMFFFFLIGFLGLMNGLVLTDSLKWLSVFWEGTTLCSFFLIRHDGTEEARRNARTALVINTIGGAAMALAGAAAQFRFGEETVSGLMARSWLLPVALLVLATFTKSAQMPFQKWLLGAMVAPTPVSALLHSSTMVKAGSYLILRLSPSFAGTPLAVVVALAGAFTFAVASALAIGQGNGKKVLAYSTIANLGLIVACTGINSPLAYAAAIIILAFHAVTKALLFMCVGTIEQQIGSRQIEDMSGIMFKMPVTTTIAAIGMVSMIMPPLGMLIGKWIAIEASVQMPIVLFLLVIGSALTVFFWAKWIGRIITSSHHESYPPETLPVTMSVTMLLSLIAVVFCGFAALPIYTCWIQPMTKATGASVDAFMGWPIIMTLGGVLLAIFISLAVFRRGSVRLPYLCGENVGGQPREGYSFASISDEPVEALVTSYYLPSIFGEEVLTRAGNLVALLIVVSMFARIVLP